MLPETAICPPNNFKPTRRPALSRPLREEPPAFLCAIVEFLRLLFCSAILLLNHVTNSDESLLLRFSLGGWLFCRSFRLFRRGFLLGFRLRRFLFLAFGLFGL